MTEGTAKTKTIAPALRVLLAVAACLLWGSAATAIKLGYRFWNIATDDIWTMVLFAGCRFTIAGVMMVVFKCVKEHRFECPKGKTAWRDAAIVCVFTSIMQYVFNFIGVGHASGVAASILNGTGSLFAIVLACTIFRQEKLTLQKAIGCLLSIAGIVVMNLNGGEFTFTLIGEGFVLIGALGGGIGTCITKIFSKRHNPVTLTGWQFIMGGLFMILLGLALGGRFETFSVSGAVCLIYLGFLSAVAFGLWNWLIQMTCVSSVSIFGFLTPIFGVFISGGVLGEWELALRPSCLGALALICLGIVIVNLKKKPQLQP